MGPGGPTPVSPFSPVIGEVLSDLPGGWYNAAHAPQILAASVAVFEFAGKVQAACTEAGLES